MNRTRSAAAVFLTALVLGPMLPVGGDPTVTPLTSIRTRVTWDLNTSTDYTNTTGLTFSSGSVWLNSTTGSVSHDTDENFTGTYDPAFLTVSGDSVRLVGNEANLLNSSTFDDGGNWTYTNGSVAVSEWDGGNQSGRMRFNTAWEQFDSMDVPAWGPVAPFGNSSTLGPSPTWREGSGALQDDVSINSFPGSYAGAQRNDGGGCPGTGCWNWSAYNRLAVWLNSSVAGLDAYLNLTDRAFVEGDTLNVTLGIGWERHVFDLTAAGVNLAEIDILQLRFRNITGSATVYVDDIVLFSTSIFPDTASINQTITKPATLLVQGGATVSFRYATSTWANVSSAWLYLELDGLTRWFQPLPANGSEWRDMSLFIPSGGMHNLQFNATAIAALDRIASFGVTVDDVVFKAPNYRNSTYTSAVINLTAAANLGTVTWTDSPAGNALIRMRSGNSTFIDPSWSPWTTATNGGSVLAPPNQYVQYEATLTTPNASVGASFDSLQFDYSMYIPLGIVETRDVAPAAVIDWELFTAMFTADPGSNILFAYSTDFGGNWIDVRSGDNLTGVGGNHIRFRATLWNVNASLTPVLDSFTLIYHHPGPLASITIAPATFTMTADVSADFTATGWDAYGNVVTITPVWSTEDPGGNVTSTGTYSPTQVGTWNITATDSGFTGTAMVTVVPGTLSSLSLVPSSGTYIAGTVVDLALSGSDADGNAVAVTNTSWLHDAASVLFQNATRLTLQMPATPGPFDVTASSGGMNATATLTIVPPALRLVNVLPLTVIEDSGTTNWSLAANLQGDDAANVSLSVTAADPALAFFATGGFGDMVVRVTPKPDAFGTTNVTITATARDGRTATAETTLTITPVDDSVDQAAAFPLVPVAVAAGLLLVLVVGLLLWRRRGRPTTTEERPSDRAAEEGDHTDGAPREEEQ